MTQTDKVYSLKNTFIKGAEGLGTLFGKASAAAGNLYNSAAVAVKPHIEAIKNSSIVESSAPKARSVVKSIQEKFQQGGQSNK